MKPTHTIRPHLLPALLLGAAAVACQGAEGKSKAAAAGAGGMPPMPVEVVAARADTVVDAILATGQIEAMQSVELRPDIEGRIAEILVREGATVARGAPLFKVDDAELRAEVARAEVDRDLARQSLARTRELLGQKASSQSELERAEATSRSTEAQLALLKVRLDRTVVRAPFAGVAGERHVSLGDYVTTSTPLLTVQTVSPQRASFQVPERYADQLEVGQQVTFRVAALVGREFTGRVDFVDPLVQLPGRTITVKARSLRVRPPGPSSMRRVGATSCSGSICSGWRSSSHSSSRLESTWRTSSPSHSVRSNTSSVFASSGTFWTIPL